MSYCSYTAQNFSSPLCKALHTRHRDSVAEKWVWICSTLWCGENDYCTLDGQYWLLHMMYLLTGFFLLPSLSVIRDQNLHDTVPGLISLDALDRSKNESSAVLLLRHS